jgi:hypothetical protein
MPKKIKKKIKLKSSLSLSLSLSPLLWLFVEGSGRPDRNIYPQAIQTPTQKCEIRLKRREK